MKKTIILTLLGVALVLAGVAAVNPQAKPLVPYEREQTKGSVRVVLLQVERVTIFNSDGVQNAQGGKVYPVPYFGITFLVEALGDEPVKIWSSNKAEMDLERQLPGNLASGGYRSNFDVSAFGIGAIELPKVANKKRCVIAQRLERASKPKSGVQKVTIDAGINGKTERFVFEGIPLN